MLKALYIIAIGLLFSGFVGFGVATFYPVPAAPSCSVAPAPATTNPFDLSGSLTDQKNKACQKQLDDFQKQSQRHDQNLSIIYLITAVIIIVISLFGLGKIAVIGDGITLGGVILLFVSLVSSFASGSPTFRFISVTAGLVIVLLLSYWKFVRPAKTAAPTL